MVEKFDKGAELVKSLGHAQRELLDAAKELAQARAAAKGKVVGFEKIAEIKASDRLNRSIADHEKLVRTLHQAAQDGTLS